MAFDLLCYNMRVHAKMGFNVSSSAFFVVLSCIIFVLLRKPGNKYVLKWAISVGNITVLLL